MSKASLLAVFVIVRSRKFSLLSFSSSKVKFKPGVMLLKEF